MKDNLFWCFVFISNKKMTTVSENTKSKNPQTSSSYVNGNSLASLKRQLVLENAYLLIFNTVLENAYLLIFNT